MHLHLIRHGQTGWNAIRRIQGHAESHLNDTGERQASELGRRLANIPFRHAYVSTSARTRETAQRVFAGRDLDVTYCADLREMRLGRWETLNWADIERDEADEVARYTAFDDTFQVEGAEGLSQMQQRGLDAVAEIVSLERRKDAGDDHRVAIVSHGFLLRAILAGMLERPLIDFAGSTALPNCAHCEVIAHDTGYRVVTIDDDPPRSGLWKSFLG